MEPRKILVVFLVLIVGICFADVAIKTSESSKSSELIDATVDILTSCYGDRGPIGVVGNVPRTLLRQLSKKLIPVILLDVTKIIPYDVFNPEIPRTTLHVFLFTATTKRQAVIDLWAIHNLRWFNPSASILAVSTLPKMENGCSQVADIMNVFVQNDILNLNVLCMNAQNRISIYGFNPHMNWAPRPWEFVGNYKYGKVSLFLFEQRYRERNGICNNLDYDKTKDLGGTTITFLNIYKNNITALINFTRLNRLDMRYITYVNFWEIYLRQMNATSIILPNIFQTGLFLHPMDIHAMPAMLKTMPIAEHHRVIVTPFRGNKSQLRKIFTVVDIYSRYCVGLTLFVTLIFFKFFSHQCFIPGMLNVIRMMCNMGFRNLPENLLTRTFLACLFLFIITIQGIFSGNLASLLTTPIPVLHARTIKDLLDMNYTILIDRMIFHSVTELKNEGRIVLMPKDIHCPATALRYASIACVDSKDYLMDQAADLKLYVSNNDIFTTYTTIISSPFWPFMDITTEIFLRMSGARVLEPLYVRVRKIRLEELQSFALEPMPPRVMNLDDLNFAFAILGIGLGCAVLSFIIEISINPVRSRIAKVRRYFRH